jgi:haloacetate dehalogenase
MLWPVRDRGARVAYRMALDHPAEVSRLALLDIIPTLEMTELINYETALQMVNQFLLSQPKPLPETLIGANAEFYLNYILHSWAAKPNLILQEARAEYLRCFKKPTVITTMCEEYRAVYLDIIQDREDRLNDKRINCPVLVVWSTNDLAAHFGDPLTIWKRWANNITGVALQCGQFLMEECPDKLLHQFFKFFEKE